MRKIVHITPHLGGGVGQVLTNVVKYSESLGGCSHEILCLDHMSDFSHDLCRERGVTALSHVSHGDILERCKEADLVHLEWWNHPLLNDFLCNVAFPPVRLLVYSHVSGYHPPAVFTEEVLEVSDIFCLSTPYSREHPLFDDMMPDTPESKVRTVFVTGGTISRVADVKPVEHDGFNVGYVGTVDFCKMHPHFVQMSDRTNIPEARFIVCGDGGDLETIRKQAEGTLNPGRFVLKGFVKNIAEIHETLDVFGYPLSSEHYGTGEQALLEAMAAGVPPVVLANGAEQHIVSHDRTGLVVNTEEEYASALEYLHANPEKRKDLALAARQHANEYFTVERMVRELHSIHDELLSQPKRERRFTRLYGASKTVIPGHMVFLNSLGLQASEYCTSRFANDVDLLVKADSKIANASPGMKTATRGSVSHYAQFFPDDSYLVYWQGLMALGSREHMEALELFEKVGGQEVPQWRTAWHEGVCLLQLRRYREAEQRLEKAVSFVPQLAHAVDILLDRA